MLIICTGWQRNCWCPSHLATSSSESVRAGLVTPSHIGTWFKGAFISQLTFTPPGQQFIALLCSLLLIRPFDPQSRGLLQTFHDWWIRGWPLHHSRGRQVSQSFAGSGGLSSTFSHRAFPRSAHCRLWKGAKMSLLLTCFSVIFCDFSFSKILCFISCKYTIYFSFVNYLKF